MIGPLISIFFLYMNIFLNRKKKYNPIGRMQDEQGARLLDEEIKNMMIEKKINYFTIDGFPENVDFIVDKIINQLNEKN